MIAAMLAWVLVVVMLSGNDVKIERHGAFTSLHACEMARLKAQVAATCLVVLKP